MVAGDFASASPTPLTLDNLVVQVYQNDNRVDRVVQAISDRLRLVIQHDLRGAVVRTAACGILRLARFRRALRPDHADIVLRDEHELAEEELAGVPAVSAGVDIR